MSDSNENSKIDFQEIFPLGAEDTPWRKLTDDHVSTIDVDGQKVLKIAPRAMSLLAETAMRDIQHLFRPGHLAQLALILEDDEASDNDKYVALELLKNANVSVGMDLPSCQDTGTAIVMGKKGQYVWTEGSDEEDLSQGIANTYLNTNLRYSQVAPLDMYEEVNTGNNLPAQIDIQAIDGEQYKFLFMAKGGGSANKSFLYQQTKALLNPDSLMAFLDEKIRTLGTAACPPYHLAVVIGGTSAEANLKTVKLASTRYLDTLPTTGNEHGQAFRDLELEAEVHKMTQNMGIGAQFGGKYFCHDVRVVRLPRHGASCPVGIGVSCSADRQILGKITAEGVFLEQLETNPAQYLPEATADSSAKVTRIDINSGMPAILEQLTQLPVKSRVMMSGTMIVARDLAHAKMRERIESGEGLPDYIKNYPVYYAGPAKQPEGYPSGSFGPTTAGRMDGFVDQFQSEGGSMVMVAKGNRSLAVTKACKKHGGFYLGGVGGAAARLAKECIKKVECLEYPELGMEAVWKIEVEDFPAFLITDDKGNDFFLGDGAA